MAYRVYQYETNCIGHLKGMPKAGDFMVQQRRLGGWRNIEGPFKSEKEARKVLEILKSRKSKQ